MKPIKVKVHEVATNKTIGGITDYTEATVIPRYNEDGKFTLSCDLGAFNARYLMPGYGLDFYMPDGSELSGSINDYSYELDGEKQAVTVSGVEYSDWMNERVAIPDPTQPFTSQTASRQYIKTGHAETVVKQIVSDNLGPTALSTRRVPLLTVATTKERGANIACALRYDMIGDYVRKQLAPFSMGYQTKRVPGQGWVFEILASSNDSGKGVFSTAIGNLSKAKVSRGKPTATFIVVAGQGEGTARNIRTYGGRSAEWASYSEKFLDQRQTNDAATLDQAGVAAVFDGAETRGINVEVVDTDSMTLGKDYRLGSYVTCRMNGVEYVDLITDIKYVSNSSGTTATPVVGGTDALYRRITDNARFIRDLSARIGRLEGGQ